MATIMLICFREQKKYICQTGR